MLMLAVALLMSGCFLSGCAEMAAMGQGYYDGEMIKSQYAPPPQPSAVRGYNINGTHYNCITVGNQTHCY